MSILAGKYLNQKAALFAVLLMAAACIGNLRAESLEEERCEYPVWSVKTQDTGVERIAYALVSKVYGTQIWTINTDNARSRVMLTSVNWNRHPYWSYDGKRVAYAGGDEKQIQQIYIMNEDGTEQIRLTTGPEDKLYPVFNQEGTALAYLSIENGEAFIYEVNPNGQGVPRLITACGKTDKDTVLSPVAYSQKGDRIAYVKLDREFKNQNIFVYNLNTKKEEQLTTAGYIGSGLAWSADGAKIAYASPGEGKNYSIYTYELKTKVTAEIVTGITPLGVSFAPDSKHLCFLRNYQVWICDSKGKNQKQLTSQEIVTNLRGWQDRKKQNFDALMVLKSYIGKTVWLRNTIMTDRGEHLDKLSEALIVNVRNKMLLPEKYRVIDDSRFGIEIEIKINKKKFYIVYLYESTQYVEDFSKYFFLTNPYTTFDWSKEEWDAIKQRTVIAGMNKTQVKLALGEPTKIIKNAGSLTELWVYKFGGTVRFIDEKVKEFKVVKTEIIQVRESETTQEPIIKKKSRRE